MMISPGRGASDQHSHALTSIRKKFRTEGVKVSGIVSKCEKIDVNRDFIVHIDDLEEIIQRSLKESRLTRRELNHLFGMLTHDRRRGNIEYQRLYEVIEGKVDDNDDDVGRWLNPQMESRSLNPGSVGEFLETAACPAEVLNFKRFIAALEGYERASGLRVKPTDEGFTIPLGPDISANIQFILPK
jgi:hypothetical protein